MQFTHRHAAAETVAKITADKNETL